MTITLHIRTTASLSSIAAARLASSFYIPMKVQSYPWRMNLQSGRQEVSPCLPICPTVDDAQETTPLQLGCVLYVYTYVGVFVQCTCTTDAGDQWEIQRRAAPKAETVLTQISGQWRNMAELGGWRKLRWKSLWLKRCRWYHVWRPIQMKMVN